LNEFVPLMKGVPFNVLISCIRLFTVVSSIPTHCRPLILLLQLNYIKLAKEVVHSCVDSISLNAVGKDHAAIPGDGFKSSQKVSNRKQARAYAVACRCVSGY
jgi:hypothetical protein